MHKIIRLEHLGIAVNDLDQANALFKVLFGKEHYKVEEVESEYVSTSFFQTGDSKVELLESSSTESAIARYIEKRGQGMHHVAFEVEDIYASMEHLRNEGFQLLNDQPKHGADNKLICFIHPKSAGGVLVELCQEIKAGHE